MYKEIHSNKRRTALFLAMFLIFVIGLGYLLSWYFNNQFILVLAVIIATVQALVSYYYSDSITLMISGAKEVPRKEPFLDLHRLVENLSITAGLPKPRIYLIEDSAPNAFARPTSRPLSKTMAVIRLDTASAVLINAAAVNRNISSWTLPNTWPSDWAICLTGLADEPFMTSSTW